MNTKMKKELINDVLTGLVVAAAFAAVIPADALAQLSTAAGNAQAAGRRPVYPDPQLYCRLSLCHRRGYVYSRHCSSKKACR